MKSFRLDMGGSSPDSGTPNQSKGGFAKLLIGCLAIGAVLWFLWGGGVEQQAASDMNGINKQVAADAVDKYNIAKRSGNKTDICVQAGLVVASYLQAKDEADYSQWQKIQASDCAAAGVPIQ